MVPSNLSLSLSQRQYLENKQYVSLVRKLFQISVEFKITFIKNTQSINAIKTGLLFHWVFSSHTFQFFETSSKL